MRGLSERFITPAPIDTAELERAASNVRRLLDPHGTPREMRSLDAWIAELRSDVDALDSDAFLSEFEPPEPLAGEWRDVVAVVAVTAAAVRRVREWNGTIPLDDVLESVSATATAAESQPVEAGWLAVRACRRVAERGERVVEADRFLKRIHGTRFGHPDQSFEAVRERVLESVRGSDPAEFRELKRTLRAAESRPWTREDLYEFSPREFEFLVADLWATYGYETTVTSQTNDGGYDVRCDGDGDLVLIEAKRHRGNVSAPTSTGVAGLIPMFEYDPERVLLVSASGFTEPAISRWGGPDSDVGLIAGRELCERLTQSPLVPPLEFP